MSKQITPGELAEVAKKLLTNPTEAGELEHASSFAGFMTEITEVVCKFCGGEVKSQAGQLDGAWLVGVRGNESLPEGGGIWADYDLDGETDS